MRAVRWTAYGLALAGVLAAAPAFATDEDDIQTTIRQQLAAFQQGDAASAFGFAAPSIQTMFRTPDVFMSMVKQSYPPIYQAQGVAFGLLAQTDRGPLQRVEFMDGEGRGWSAFYMMEHETDGAWRIQGCVLQRSENSAI